MQHMRTLIWGAFVALVMAACASGDPGGDNDGSVNMPADASPIPDDAEVPCFMVTCTGFEFCSDDTGMCEEFPSCADDGSDAGPATACEPGATCVNDHCVPDDLDIDGDGYPAMTDCDETNENINPGMEETCNGIDDDCQFGPDDGDPVDLCLGDPTGDLCADGNCGCAEGTFDIDPNIPNCECVAAPLLSEGTSCATAIDLGNVSDTGQSQIANGNIVPDGRRVWYKFRGVDNADTSCDNYHVRARLIANPDDQFRIGVVRGSCNEQLEAAFTDYDWATDMRETINNQLSGECPCSASNPPPANVSPCTNNSADYFVVIERLDVAPLTCDAFTLEVTNGVYNWN